MANCKNDESRMTDEELQAVRNRAATPTTLDILLLLNEVTRLKQLLETERVIRAISESKSDLLNARINLLVDEQDTLENEVSRLQDQMEEFKNG